MLRPIAAMHRATSVLLGLCSRLCSRVRSRLRSWFASGEEPLNAHDHDGYRLVPISADGPILSVLVRGGERIVLLSEDCRGIPPHHVELLRIAAQAHAVLVVGEENDIGAAAHPQANAKTKTIDLQDSPQALSPQTVIDRGHT